ENLVIKDCDWSSLKCINTLIKNIEFKDDFITKFNEDTFFDKVFFNKSTVVSYEDLYNVYMTLASKFESNKLTKVSGEYYYLAKCEERKFLSGIDKVKSYIYWLLCGYGERPTYSLITSLEILIIFTIIYMFTGISVNGELIKYDMSFILNLPIENFHLDFLNSLYFSIVTFTTVGYGDIIPVGIMSMVLSGIEMVIGITMAGVWTAILARKITR
ncbi:MAG: potassium channel family protein, partial [Peptostreptococcaceae bacterium]